MGQKESRSGQRESGTGWGQRESMPVWEQMESQGQVRGGRVATRSGGGTVGVRVRLEEGSGDGAPRVGAGAL